MVDDLCSHSLNKAIQERLQLIISCDFLVPNLTKFFHWSRWMHVDVMYMKQACLTLLLQNLNKGPHINKGVSFESKLGFIS